jgi:hypothetical protein
MKSVSEMNREELIEYAIKFNIFKKYDFAEYVQNRQIIMDRMQELNIEESDVHPNKNRIAMTNYRTI